MEGPFKGVRILTVEQYAAGPYATMFFSDLGADVIKIEDPKEGGDFSRAMPPDAAEGDSLFFQAFNRGKRSLGLDLRDPKGQEIFHRLVEHSDAVFCNLRPEGRKRLGLDYEALKHVNPRIVCCMLTGFGSTGPRANEPAFDYSIQALSGFMSLTGEPDAPPAKSGVSIIDFSGGILAAFALSTGLTKAARTGRGCDVEVGLYDMAISLLNYLACWHLNAGFEPKRTRLSAHPSVVPAQNFKTKDGWIAVMCSKEKFFPLLCDIMGLPDVPKEPRFLTPVDRLNHRDELVDILQERFLERTTEEWIADLADHVPSAPVRTVHDALLDPQVAARNMIIELDHPRMGTIREVGCPVKVDGYEPGRKPGPGLAQHTSEILSELGLGEVETADADR